MNSRDVLNQIEDLIVNAELWGPNGDEAAEGGEAIDLVTSIASLLEQPRGTEGNYWRSVRTSKPADYRDVLVRLFGEGVARTGWFSSTCSDEGGVWFIYREDAEGRLSVCAASQVPNEKVLSWAPLPEIV